MIQTGLMSWSQVEMYAMRPFHPRTFWKHANTLYRHFSVFFLAHTLQVRRAGLPKLHCLHCCGDTTLVWLMLLAAAMASYVIS